MVDLSLRVYRHFHDNLEASIENVAVFRLSLVRTLAKKRQMQWTRRGAHLLLQARTRTLDATLRLTFERWFPGLAAENAGRAIPAKAA
jgi:hypothetical protein